MRRESSNFEVWPRFVAAQEALAQFEADLPEEASEDMQRHARQAIRLLADGRELLTWLGSARVPMPKSKRDLIARCEAFALLEQVLREQHSGRK